MLETTQYHSFRLPEIIVHRCEVGEQLYQDWKDAMKIGLPELIYAAMRTYFIHKNGGKRNVPCHECRYISKN